MLGEGTTAIFITFLLAIIGYVGLTVIIVLTLRDRHPILLWRIIALIVLSHVLMVWMYRYEWQFDLAVRNGYAGFVIFHTALVLILTSSFFAKQLAHRLIHIAFVIVTTGAIGASFRYSVVAKYRIIVIACALVGITGLIRHYIWGRLRKS